MMAEAQSPAASNERTLRITLVNQGSEPAHLAPGSIHLAAISSGGRTVWTTVIHNVGEIVIPPGGNVAWNEAVPVIPPGATRLRVEAMGARSADLVP